MNYDIYRTTGRTEDGRRIVGGLFEGHDTVGVPLTMQAMLLIGMGAVPDFHDFAIAALDAGWNGTTVIAAVREAAQDNDLDWPEIEKRLALTIGKRIGIDVAVVQEAA